MIQVTTKGLVELDIALETFEQRVKDKRQFFDLVGAMWVADIQNNFRKSQDPFGQKWQPVNYNRYENGRKYARNSNPLLDTGRLVSSINYISTNSSLDVGTHLIYSETHNQGLRGVKQRQFIPDASQIFNTNLGDSLNDAIQQYYLGVFDEF